MPESHDIFEFSRIRQNRNRCAKNLADHNFLIDWAMEQIIDRLTVIKRDFEAVLFIGCRSSAELDKKLIETSGAKTIFHIDIAEKLMSDRTRQYVLAREDFLPFADNSFDLVVSPFGLHTVNDLPGALIQAGRVLKPDGSFLAAMPGGETLYQLRESLMATEMSLYQGASPRIFPYADKQQAGALMQRAGFALPVVDSEMVTVTYENIFKLMHDLRYMGEASTLETRKATRDLFMAAGQYYTDHFSESDGRIPATFEMIFMIGWAPHASQQKPLRPGSADRSLADALDTEEIETGETAQP